MDLILVAPSEKVPVCRIGDYGKFKYELIKKEKEAKKAHRGGVIKELKITPKIDEHDFQVRVNRSKEFLEKGYKVKVTLTFRGREVVHKEIGERLISRLSQAISEKGIPEGPPKLEGKNLILIFAPSRLSADR